MDDAPACQLTVGADRIELLSSDLTRPALSRHQRAGRLLPVARVKQATLPNLVPGLRIELNYAGLLDQSPRPAEFPGILTALGVEPEIEGL